jgi:hypothetical protein
MLLLVIAWRTMREQLAAVIIFILRIFFQVTVLLESHIVVVLLMPSHDALTTTADVVVRYLESSLQIN